MADDSDVLLQFCEQQYNEAKQAEDQRAAITNIILVIASAVLAFIVQRPLDHQTLPLTILLIVLGLYGGITVEKLYERHQFHSVRAWAWRARLDELHPNAQLEKRKNEAVELHNKNFRIMHRIRLHNLWCGLHFSIAIAGAILTVVAI